MAWEVEVTDEFEAWYVELDDAVKAKVIKTIDQLEARGPALPRPLVGEVRGSRLHNLKELRPPSSTVRILFIFDPRRAAVLLVGGDKAEHGWNEWYPGAIADAERLYDEYLDQIRREGLIE